jgi:cyclophilin family peptidyl-prolyl cis-trans isomerase
MTPAPYRRATGALALVALAAFVVGACTSGAGGAPSAAPAESGATGSSAAPAGDCSTSQPDPLPAGETRTVTISTDQGDITMRLSADLSPIAVGNFVALAECGYYDGVVFHRVVPKFVIQGGDPTGTGTGGPGYTIEDEPVTTAYKRGTVAMARTADPNSVGSQFFIVSDDSAAGALSSYNTYQIIGEVTAGMEVVDAITAAAGGVEIPTDPVVMNTVTVSNP